ncbi:MAG: hypothetical protein M3Y49_08635 [Actinomycetota bacterium]|nr:hypothetical protein [Actinomycetota bacterium]
MTGVLVVMIFKTIAVTALTGAFLLGGAGAAQANTWHQIDGVVYSGQTGKTWFTSSNVRTTVNSVGILVKMNTVPKGGLAFRALGLNGSQIGNTVYPVADS